MPRGTPVVPKEVIRQEFGKRLYALMLQRGWTQSELSRRSGLPRDRISTYIRGKSLPSPALLQQLSTTFNMEADELLPFYAEHTIDTSEPALEIKASADQPHLSWLRVNRLVTTTTALKIAELLEVDNAHDGARNRGSSAVQPGES